MRRGFFAPIGAIPSGIGTATRSRGQRWRRVGLAVAGGAALGMAAPPVGAVGLGLASPALLLAAIEGGATGAPTGTAFALGALMGAVTNAVALSWVVTLLQVFAGFPLVAAVPVAALLWVLQGLPFALAAGGTAAVARRGAPAWLVLPAACTLAFTLTPRLFPWRPSTIASPVLPFIQVAELGGAPLLDFLILLAGCALARLAWPGLARPRRLAALATVALTLLLPYAYGTVRLPEVAALRARAPELRVGVVQPNVGIFEKRDPMAWDGQMATLRRMTRALEARGAELVVWPETSYPFPFFRDRWRDPPGVRAVLADGVSGPVLFGALTQRDVCARWNSVVALAPDGQVVGRADKVHLLAFGETVPLWHWLPPLRARFVCPGLTAGHRPELVRIANTRIAVLNCYEDILPHYARRLAARNPQLLVNVTNDAWFGRTAEPWLHDEAARLRSVETRRDLVRAVNTGVSAYVLATGEEAVRTRTWVRTSFVADARLLDLRTPWVRFGDLISPALAGALFGVILALRRRRR